MSESNTYNYLASYLDKLRSRGRYTFTGDEIKEQFGLNDEAYYKVVQRLLDKGRISRLRQNFYLIIPPEYSGLQTLPLGYYIDDLMQFLGKDYYVGLLTAAMYYGSAHQQPQRQFVVHRPPSLRSIENSRQVVIFCKKSNWSDEDIDEMKTDAGYINISTPSLTVFDLILYVNKIGGFGRAATVIKELIPDLDKEVLKNTSQRFEPTTTIQRVGYVFDYILKEKDLADVLYETLQAKSYYPTPLSTSVGIDTQKAPNRWKIITNIEIEPDI